MENEILELLEQKGSVSMNDDIFPLVEKEFEGQVIGTELYELAHQYISQTLLIVTEESKTMQRMMTLPVLNP